jgi:hypothetical protein
MKKLSTLSKERMKNDAMIHYGASKEEALQVYVEKRKQISTMVEESETHITWETTYEERNGQNSDL